jgi:hypothetical protein
MSLLDLIHNTSATDKYALGYIHEFYNEIFSDKKYSTTKVLEIGIWQGGSILLWRDFFPNAVVYGVDISYCAALEKQDRVIQLNSNAYSTEFTDQFEKNSFDVIIDDGPHTLESMIFYIIHYLPLVKVDGLFILEDIIAPSWTPLLIDIIKLVNPSALITHHDMRGKQKDPYLLELWKSGLDVLVVQNKCSNEKSN